ncbi:hypothetical protein K466DRAFT_566475 [Polyporus arcularius HHB13444]|uniref:PEBP-like protein n=1 Tax=Polyporus arcularius HHB13444 TaxID=1314778 RepID=A0A5C3PID5_9APHY|nr:hypothetical protein K466DRAFT_566475 [Polyporus arcularius HHB13444]
MTVILSPFSGTIVSPVANDTIVPGVEFPFEYDISNWCESAYSPFTVYLTEAPPSFDNVTTDGTLAPGTYIHNFGTYLVSNFGLPLSDDAKSPPPSFVLPEAIARVYPITQRFFSVVQEYDGCPGHIAKEFSVTFVPISVDGSSA